MNISLHFGGKNNIIIMKEIFEYTTEICLLIIVISMVVLTALWIEITEPLKTAWITIIWAFFGAKVPWIVNKKKENE